MFETKTKVKLTWWPSPQDYNEAVQNPHVNLQDDELRTGLVYLDSMDLPRPVTGAFASVYRLQCEGRDTALRCFLRNIADQEQRYALISEFVRNDSLPYTVTFDFLPQGIRIASQWVPVLKMEWVEGQSLDEYIGANLGKPEKLEKLADSLVTMMADLRSAGVAHGDLQHGNVIVIGSDEIRLVDYDGMFVPSMQNFLGNELGHRNYQHPLRTAQHFGPRMDNFSAWVIYTSIMALRIDPSLWKQLAAGDDCLLFRQADFQSPHSSAAFAALETHNNQELRRLSRFIRSQLQCSPVDVPFLELPVPEVLNLEPLSPSVSRTRKGPRIVSTALPEWLRDDKEMLKQAQVEDSPESRTNIKVSPVDWISPSGASASTVRHTVPAELERPLPRPVEYNPAHPSPSPMALQYAMLFNPLVWAMCVFCFLSYGPDAQLKANGYDFPVRITNVFGYNQNSTIFLNAEYTYEMNGIKYKGSTTGIPTSRRAQLEQAKNSPDTSFITVHALPQDPAFAEELFAPVGTRQRADGAIFTIALILNLLTEWFIWFPAWMQRYFVRHGIATLAEVSDKMTSRKQQPAQMVAPVSDKPRYQIELKFTTKDMRKIKTVIRVTEYQYRRLSVGDVVTVLYEPSYPWSVVVYKFCRYRVATPKKRRTFKRP